MLNDLFEIRDDGVIVLRVHAQPGAGRTAVAGTHGDALKVRVAAPPEGGRANEALTKHLASVFGVKAAEVTLKAGESSRAKRFHISGVAEEEFRRLLEAAIGAASPGPQAAPRHLRGR